MVNQLIFEQDMTKEVRLRQIHGSLFSNDNNGLQIGVRIVRNGTAENITGTVICEVLRQDGALVVVNGNRSGNLASAVIPSSCLMPGMAKIILKNVVDSQKTVLLAISGAVYVVDGSAYIDSGSIIPDLTAYESLVTRAETAASAISNLAVSAELIEDQRYQCSVTKTG